MPKKAAAKPDKIYQEVTDKIIAALEEGTVPWQRPWKVEGLHRNLSSKKNYRGINQWLLDLTAMSEGYDQPYWMTYKQAQALGGQVRQGEKSSIVVFFKPLPIEVEEKNGKGVMEKRKKIIPLLRHYRVFNIAQIDGIDPKKIPAKPEHQEFKPVERAEKLLKGMPNAPKISHGGNRAYYSPMKDAIRLPGKKQFVSPEAYYATSFHEHVHATGHKSRTGRVKDWANFGSDPYAKEELVAELGASMLCALTGVETPEVEENAVAYIQSWIKRFKEDKKLLVSAGAQAQKACDNIQGIEPAKVAEVAKEKEAVAA